MKIEDFPSDFLHLVDRRDFTGARRLLAALIQECIAIVRAEQVRAEDEFALTAGEEE